MISTPPLPVRPVPTKNRFQRLEIEEEKEVYTGVMQETLARRKGEGNRHPLARRPCQTEQAKPTRREGPSQVLATHILERPHHPSYFLPGRVHLVPLQFLVDTGCTTNLLSKRVFDQLPPEVRETMQDCARQGYLADGSPLPFFGVIRLVGRIRSVPTEVDLVVSQISEDVILGMPFLEAHGCLVNFGKATIRLAGQDLACNDREGRRLRTLVQVLRQQHIPPQSEKLLVARVTARNYGPLGLVEGGVPF